MASRRNRPTLYEVVNRSRRKSSKPRPFSTGSSSSSSAVATPDAPEHVDDPPTQSQPDTAASERIVIPAPRPKHLEDGANAKAARPPRMRWANDVLEARLDATDLMLGGLLAFALMIGVFFAGRQSLTPTDPTRDDLGTLVQRPTPPTANPYEEAPSNWPTATTNQQPVRQPDEVLTPRNSSVATNRDITPPRPQPLPANPQPASQAITIQSFEPKKYYIVLQHFRNSEKRDALAAQRYMKDGGVDVVLLPGKDIRLIANQPFATHSEAVASSLRKQIRALGKDYTGGYDFKDCYPNKINRGR